ncbi:SET domain-containing protein [Aerophototrophica crusticola]|uniref:SET domain-containing protein n=1 Tax=Aerophototrophica crusticola TaxID=1709002 RepID=A0A858R6L1_9PROT|nr:SET domain-containing protein [Rhodospirillaceae bacterium B3]
MPLDTLNRVAVRDLGPKGRGMVALLPIPRGLLIDSAPVLILPPEDRRRMEDSRVAHYWFYWDEGATDEDWSAAIALGPVSLCNHSEAPNSRFEADLESCRIDLYALRDIQAGEEITFDYGCELWFEVKD